jgi:acyl-CoA reductase-like NAD-dependent aldehyde dehydrogenase
LIEEHGDELAALEALNSGKAVTIARNVDVKGAADVLRCVSRSSCPFKWRGIGME